MLSDDVYRTRFRAVVGEIEAWLETLHLVARVEVGRDEASWRAAVEPHMREACPFELMLRVDQRFDLTVGSETYEDQVIASLDLFAPLLHSIVVGRVVTRQHTTIATGTLTKIETIIAPIDCQPWVGVRQLISKPLQTVVHRDRHYVPYVRGA